MLQINEYLNEDILFYQIRSSLIMLVKYGVYKIPSHLGEAHPEK